MQGANLHIGSSLGFSDLLKDTPVGPERERGLNQQPSGY